MNSPSLLATLSVDPDERARQLDAMRRNRSVLDLDPPEHTRLRQLISRAFTANVVEASRGRIIEIADGLLDAFEAPTVDLVSRYALLVPILVICAMLGVPPEERAEFVGIGNRVVRSVDPDVPVDERIAANAALRAYVAGLLDARRRDPGDDVVTRLLDAAEDGRIASRDELLINTGVLLIAGFETTTNLITSTVHQLLRHPDQLARLRADPTLIRTTIEETLRFDPPVHMMRPRPVVAETAIGDIHIQPGEAVVPLLAAASRDPDEFADPDTFDIGRRVNRHLGFGVGHHFCVGSALARMEAQIAVRRLLERFPGLALTGEEPEVRPTLSVRGLSRLVVAV
jgi:cytochrome P450